MSGWRFIYVLEDNLELNTSIGRWVHYWSQGEIRCCLRVMVRTLIGNLGNHVTRMEKVILISELPTLPEILAWRAGGWSSALFQRRGRRQLCGNAQASQQMAVYLCISMSFTVQNAAVWPPRTFAARLQGLTSNQTKTSLPFERFMLFCWEIRFSEDSLKFDFLLIYRMQTIQ